MNVDGNPARRVPYTAAVVVAMLVLAVATGALWSSVEGSGWYPEVSYGVPSLEAGRWWTFLAGPFFALTPLFYLPMAGSFALLVGFTEARLGTRRTIAITVVAQLATTVLAALILLALERTGWAWAERLADTTDVGFSAGALSAGVVLSVTLRPRWRWCLLAGLGGYVAVSILFVGSLADLEHLLAVGLTVPFARRLARLRSTQDIP